MAKQVKKVTGIEELNQIARGEIVELPGWTEDQLFVARLRRPSLQILSVNGTIPNSLLGTASKLFSKGQTAYQEMDLADITKVEIEIARASLIEPTYEEIEEAGLTLTDLQLLAIFQYSQSGVKGLERFHTKPTDNKDNKPKQDIQ